MILTHQTLTEEEMVTEVDEYNNYIGLKPRSTFYGSKHIHRSVGLLLFNSAGQLLVQKKSQQKRVSPGMRSYSVSGTVADESYSDCIERETWEELGIHCDCKHLFRFLTIQEGIAASWKTIFTAISDDALCVDRTEIDSVEWVDVETLQERVKTHNEQYTRSFITGVSMYFEQAER